MKAFLPIIFAFVSLQSYASELYIQMEIPTNYTIKVGDQSITSSTGKFRFFDLPAGAHTFYVYNTNMNDILVAKELYIANNTRTVVFISSMGNPIVQGSYPLVERDWYDTYLLSSAGSISGNASVNRNFEEFIKTMQETHTDARKLQLASDFIEGAYLTSNHVEIILRTFQNDSNRITFAKKAYDRITDQSNYFIWKDAFDFKTSYQKVENAIKSKR